MYRSLSLSLSIFLPLYINIYIYIYMYWITRWPPDRQRRHHPLPEARAPDVPSSSRRSRAARLPSRSQFWQPVWQPVLAASYGSQFPAEDAFGTALVLPCSALAETTAGCEYRCARFSTREVGGTRSGPLSVALGGRRTAGFSQTPIRGWVSSSSRSEATLFSLPRSSRRKPAPCKVSCGGIS